jgi:hypothetical protein
MVNRAPAAPMSSATPATQLIASLSKPPTAPKKPPIKKPVKAKPKAGGKKASSDESNAKKGKPGPAPGNMSRYDSSLGLLTRKFTNLIQVRLVQYPSIMNQTIEYKALLLFATSICHVIFR